MPIRKYQYVLVPVKVPFKTACVSFQVPVKVLPLSIPEKVEPLETEPAEIVTLFRTVPSAIKFAFNNG